MKNILDIIENLISKLNQKLQINLQSTIEEATTNITKYIHTHEDLSGAAYRKYNAIKINAQIEILEQLKGELK